MTPSRFLPIPRFALPYTLSDCAAGLRSIVGQTPPPVFDLLGDSPKFWTRSGRQALRLLLTALDLKPLSGIALPLFTDPSLVSAIVAAGHRPIFIDIEPRYLTMDPKSLLAARGRFDAVVVVHLFGQMADLPALHFAAGGKFIIEDAAHAPLSVLNGVMAGSFGSASFYSFASTKYWPAGGGGLAVVHDAVLAEKFARAAEALSPPSRARELLYVALQTAKATVFTRRLYGFVGKPLRRWAEEWALLEPTLDLSAIPRPYAAVACRQVLRFRQRVRAQRARSLRLLARVSDVRNVVLPTERPGARYNYHLFPVVLQSRAERDAVRKAMWDKFVDTSTIYSEVVKQCRLFGYRGDCPVAEAVSERLITIPNHAALRSHDIDRVAQVFLSSLRACRKMQPVRRFEQPDVLHVIEA
jgi:perosamine synthetase